jgi:hypothetical protein
VMILKENPNTPCEYITVLLLLAIAREIWGAFHFFARRVEVVKYRENTRKERREHESEEEHP